MMKQNEKTGLEKISPKKEFLKNAFSPWWCEVHPKPILEDDDNRPLIISTTNTNLTVMVMAWMGLV